MARLIALVALGLVLAAVLAFVVFDVRAEALVVALVTLLLLALADWVSRRWP